MRVTDSLCRLSVQADDDESSTVDLALPSETQVGLLMPSIVDMVHRDTIVPTEVRRWLLSRVGGQLVDESTTLNENDVRDGDLLLLTTTQPPTPEWVEGDSCHKVARVAYESRKPEVRVVAAVACLCGAAISVTGLVWSGTVSHTVGHLVTGAAMATAAAVGAVVVRRAHPDPLPCVALSVIAVAAAAGVGFLAVPAGPSGANALLAAAAGFSMSILLLRVTGCGTVCLTAISAFTATVAATATGGVILMLSTAATGAALASLSLGVLGAAARLSIAAAGLAPAMPADDDRAVDARAIVAHQTLTGLVVGSSASSALGAALVASGLLHEGTSRLSAVAFAAVVGLVLLLRARTHVGSIRQTALGAGGMISVTAGFAVVMVSTPGQAHWVSLVAAAAGVAALGRVVGLTVSPIAHRAVDLLDYLALASVVPLACWVGDLYGLVRGMSLR
jgi:type VII secretion integral membrane protein EccD